MRRLFKKVFEGIREFRVARISIWREDRARVKHILTHKSEVLMGTDPSCAIRLQNGPSMRARLDLDRMELVDLGESEFAHRAQVKSFEEQRFFEFESQIFSVRFFRIRLWMVVLPVAIAVALWLLVVSVPKSLSCNEQFLAWQKSPAAQGFDRARVAFDRAVRRLDLLLALSEMRLMKEAVADWSRQVTCDPSPYLKEQEQAFQEARILEALSTEEYARALELWGSFANGSLQPEKMSRRFKQLVYHSAREMARRSWSLTDRDRTQSLYLRQMVEEICERMGQAEDCFDRLLRNNLRSRVAKRGED